MLTFSMIAISMSQSVTFVTPTLTYSRTVSILSLLLVYLPISLGAHVVVSVSLGGHIANVLGSRRPIPAYGLVWFQSQPSLDSKSSGSVNEKLSRQLNLSAHLSFSHLLGSALRFHTEVIAPNRQV